MQFAGQRTDMNLQPVGQPVNTLITLPSDVVPDPEAIFITGITPQQTVQEGVSEAAFLKQFEQEIATPGTIFVGYNSVRFDDEFMRFLLYRNFYDPYEWQYTNDKSRWDLLDVVRMTRALRPDGISWPVDDKGAPTNRLELLTKANGIAHESAHDALSDVYAVIEIAKLIQQKQPKLFDFLLQVRTKKAAEALVKKGQPFIYTSGKYDSAFEKTTVVAKVADHPKRGGCLVFDLRYDPKPFATMSIPELVEAWRWKKDRTDQQLPIKTLQYNRCPAIAPLGVLDAPSQKRLQLDMQTIEANLKKLRQSGLADKTLAALDILDAEQEQTYKSAKTTVDGQLYDGFIGDTDKRHLAKVHTASGSDLQALDVRFSDIRLQKLLPLYKARNFPASLSSEEQAEWEQFRHQRLLDGGENSRLARYFARLNELASQDDISSEKQFLLEELRLWGESIVPADIEN